MNEELKIKLLSYLNNLENIAEATSEFAKEQSPLIVQELLEWIFWSNVLHSFYIIFPIVFILTAKRRFLRIKRLEKDITYSDGIYSILSPIIYFSVFGIISVAILINSISSIEMAIKVKVAPRIVLIESLKKLINEK